MVGGYDTQCARADLQEVILSSYFQIDDPMVLLIAILEMQKVERLSCHFIFIGVSYIV